MGYTIKFSAHAARAFRKLPRAVQVRMHSAIEPLKKIREHLVLKS